MTEEEYIDKLESLLRESNELLTMVHKARGGMMIAELLKRITKTLSAGLHG